MGVTNTIATIPGFVAPIVVQELTGEDVSNSFQSVFVLFMIAAARDI